MDSVSSFFENILTVEAVEPTKSPPTKPVASEVNVTSNPISNNNYGSNMKRDSSTNVSLSSTSKRRSELDFSSFWKYNLLGLSDDSKKAGSGSGSYTNTILMDKLVEKVITMMLPIDVNDLHTSRVLNARIECQKERPPLSINIMSKNSRQMAQRLSDTFIFIDNCIIYFSWSNPFYTIGVLTIITHLILNPYFLSIFPLVMLIVRVIIPHYLIVYPPDTSYNSTYFKSNPIPSEVPLNDYKIPKPIPEFSREFVMNFTDMQNHMSFHIDTFDFMTWLTSDYLYFKDENVTSIVLLLIIGLITGNLIILPRVIPFFLRNIYLVQIMLISFVWGFTILFHPSVKSKIMEWIYNEDTRLNALEISNRLEVRLLSYLIATENEPSLIQNNEAEAIAKGLIREVEIFELQRLDRKTKFWKPIGFTNNIYTINTATRKFNVSLLNMGLRYNHLSKEELIREINNSYIRLNKKSSIDDISAPNSWKFVDGKKWELDLDCKKWVKSKLVEDLVHIDDDEKWVYDLHVDDENIANDGDDTDTSNGGHELGFKEVYRRRRWVRYCSRYDLRTKQES
ncbi:integral peroxisomal membrane peroxin-domain-containing protein [Scheffersomyces coipomensis]|uniref:integral peroxisomal membrane peroxin-domain-containing protein n=1 Tax=Scheffersomyces coipomensis TaxID=1788519 RepID=UPI00315C5339